MDVKKGDRLEYNGVECEVLWTHKPQGKAPTVVLLAEIVELVDDDGEFTGKYGYGERYRVTKADLEIGGEGAEAVVAEGHWAGELSDDAIGSLIDAGIGRAEAVELGEAGLVKLKGIGKATAAKVLEAAGA